MKTQTISIKIAESNFGDYEILRIAKRLSRGPTAAEIEAHTRSIQIELDHVFARGYAKGQRDGRQTINDLSKNLTRSGNL